MGRIVKNFLIILLIIIIICINFTPVYASLRGAVRSELPSRPAPAPSVPSVGPSTPTPTPSQPEPEQPSEDKEVHETGTIEQTIPLYNYVYIKGNVVEDLGEQYSVEDGKLVNNDDPNAIHTIPIKDIIVTCTSSDGSVKPIRTNENGEWIFKDLPEGEYTIDYYYGRIIDESELTDENAIKNILKYNGQDYLVKSVHVGSAETNSTITTEYDMEIYEEIQRAESLTQVMLVVDCSGSMNEKIEIDGQKKRKLDIAVDSAKSLIKQLFEDNHNIRVGLVSFSEDSIVESKPTNNLNNLNKALENLRNNPGEYYTDIATAINTASEQFYTDNRYIVLVSDGIPTKAGDNDDMILYSDDSDEEFNKKLSLIQKETKKVITKVLENTKIFSLFTLPEDDEVKEFVEEIFEKGFENNENNVYKQITENGQELEDVIKNVIKHYIYTEAEENSNKTTGYDPAVGYEDYKRYQKICENFPEWNLINTKEFKMINSYTYDKNKDDVIPFSKKIYGIAHGGTYTISHKYTEAPPDEVEVEGEVTRITHYEVVDTGYEDEQLVLAKRPTFSLNLDVDVTGVAVILDTGTTYINKQKKDMPSNEYLMVTLEKELAYGSELLVTFSGKIKNETKMPYSKLQMICYFPKFLNIQYGSNSCFTDCKPIDLKEYYNDGYIGEQAYNAYKDDKQAYLLTFEFKNAEDIKKTLNDYEFKLKASMLMNRLDDLDDITCISEVFSYSNDIEYLDTNKQSIPSYTDTNNKYMILDNDIKNDNKIDSNNIIKNMSRRMTMKSNDIGAKYVNNMISMYQASDTKESAEIDWNESIEVSVIPPTGLTKKMIKQNKICQYTLRILIVLLILIVELKRRIK